MILNNIWYQWKKIDNLKSIDQIDDYLLYKERKGLILGKENGARMISLKSLDINKLRAFYEINLNEVIDSDLPIAIIGKTTASRLNLRTGDEIKLMRHDFYQRRTRSSWL